jgi:hypothetical protein
LEKWAYIFATKMKFVRNKYIFLLIQLLIFQLGTTFGQGSIQGIIKDKKSQETIPGVNVLILGTNIGAATDLDGKYQISNVTAGTYSIVISFISYKSDTLKGIKVQNGKITTVDHQLEELTRQLGGVTVQERRKTNTDVSIISSIKQSNLIVSGISSQQILRSQDKDASEVIRRVPGITVMDNRFVVVRGLIERYNSVWLNNSSTPSTETDQRAFSFDVIPSNMINNILVYKTPAPELPADFAGASIQIFTKNLPEKNSISFGYSATYNQGTTFQDFEKYKGSKTDWLGFDNGMRTLSDNIPSTEEMIQIQNYNSGTEEEQAAKKARMLEIVKSFSTVSSTTKIKAPFDNRFNVDISRLFNLKSMKIGNITALSYKTSYDSEVIERSSVESYGTTNEGVTYSKNYTDDQYSHSVEIGGLHNWSVSFGKNIIEFRNLLNQKGKSTTTIRNGLDHYRDDNKIYKTQLGYVSKTIYSGNLGGEHKFGDDISSFIWNAGYSYANRTEPDVRLITYYSTKTSDTSYYPYQLEYSFNPNADANARLFSRVQEHIVNLNLNYNHKLEFGNFTPEIKIGSFLEKRKRDFYIRPFGIVWAKPGVFNQTVLLQPLDSVYDLSNFSFTDGVMYREIYNSRYRYKADNSLMAGYISLKIPITGFINVYAGVRAEKYRLVLSGFQSKNDSLTPNITSDTLNFFPSASMTINLSKKVLFRLAYGKTINRPEFREMAPFAFYDFQENVIVYGNDTIQSCYINNYDARLEWYPSPGEMITLGGFYKEFQNPIEATWTPASSGEWDLRYINAIKANSIGVELDIRKSLNFLANSDNFLKVLKNFTLVANASLIRCKVETDLDFVRDNNRPMYGQSPFIVNTGLYYQNERGDLSISVLYNIFGKRIIGIGTPEKPNSYEMPRHNLDFTLIKKVGSSMQIKIGAKDLLDSEHLTQQVMTSETLTEDALIKVKSFYPGRSFSVGLSYSL